MYSRTHTALVHRFEILGIGDRKDSIKKDNGEDSEDTHTISSGSGSVVDQSASTTNTPPSADSQPTSVFCFMKGPTSARCSNTPTRLHLPSVRPLLRRLVLT